MDPRRRIPAVDRLLASDAFAAALERWPRDRVVRATHAVQETLRQAIAGGDEPPARIAEPAWYAERVEARLTARDRPSLRPVINATGVVLHTNLGRAPLSAAARAAVDRVVRSYANLEYDLEAGTRGSRYDHCADLLAEITGAEAALIVNNNAAAVVLALNTLAATREAVISRGELVEIGGSFRIPEIMEKSGAAMVEVGATNRVHPRDYEAALSDSTGAILKVHRSNFEMRGFTADVPLAALVELGHARGVPVLTDLGSGLLRDPAEMGLPDEPTAGAVLRTGADVVTMSGDKLLGGPQAGILLGREDLITRMRGNPLCRAFRVDKMTLAAMEATLAAYRDSERVRREIPVLRMFSASAEAVEERARPLAEALRERGVESEVTAGSSAVGGGAYPEAELPTALVSLAVQEPSAAELARRLRASDPPIIVRIINDRVALDLRTVGPEEEDALLTGIVHAID